MYDFINAKYSLIIIGVFTSNLLFLNINNIFLLRLCLFIYDYFTKASFVSLSASTHFVYAFSFIFNGAKIVYHWLNPSPLSRVKQIMVKISK